jgi:hypothetical protein
MRDYAARQGAFPAPIDLGQGALWQMLDNRAR